MTYFELIFNRKRKNTLIVMFDYCSEGIWGKNAYYRFTRLPKELQKDFLKWINDSQATYFFDENNKYRLKKIDKKGLELSFKLKKTLIRYKVLLQSENGSKFIILKNKKINFYKNK